MNNNWVSGSGSEYGTGSRQGKSLKRAEKLRNLKLTELSGGQEVSLRA